MTRHRNLWVAVLLGAMALRCSAGWMFPLSIEELKERADLILHAIVRSKACERAAEGHIITRVQLEVSAVLKGTLKTNAFEIVHNGGIIGDIGETSSIQAEYGVGEETVVFLRLNERGEGVTIGIVQGKFHVWQDKTTGEKFAHNPFHGTTRDEAVHDAKRTTETTKPTKLALRELTRRAKGESK